MMQFTLGLAIIAFTLIVGSYQYFENDDLIKSRKYALEEAINRRTEMQRLKLKVAGIKNISMETGNDQKFSIEKMLNIGAPNLEFNFIGQGKSSNNSGVIYRHSFRIKGPASFSETMDILRKLSKQKGFVVSRVCYSCQKSRKELPNGKVIVQIEGFLYVYNPAKVI